MKRIKIKKMPSKKMLEAFLKGMFRQSRVIFDNEKGRFRKNG